MTRFFITLITTLFLPVAVSAQETDITQEKSIVISDSEGNLRNSPFGLSLELSTKYLWRGIEYGDAPIAFATIDYGHKGFGAWIMGAYAFNGSHQEIDLGITYSTKWFTIGVSDYYYPSAVGNNDRYFDMDNHTTGHWGELYVTATPFRFPLWATVSTYIYGADKKPDGRQAYSSYAEIGYTYMFMEKNAISLAIGANLNKGFYTDYESGFNVSNITLKYATAFSLGNFKLPVSASVMYNPYRDKCFFSFSAYFNI